MARVDNYFNAQIAVDLEVEDEGVSQGFFSKLNFIGAGVSAEQAGGDPQTCNITITGGAGVADHGALTGLSDDDHPQYQLRSEKNTANGYVGLDASSKIAGSHIIYGTAANTACEGNDPRLFDARQPIAHASSHERGGTDPIDGDHLDIDFVPTNYTRDISALEASSVEHLTAHLKGIDVEIGDLRSSVADHGSLSGLGDDDHPQYQLRSEKGLANGYAGLDASGKIPGTNLLFGSGPLTVCEGNDPRLLTQDENDAAQGTSGIPSNTNRFVTNSDTRLSDTRDPNAHQNTHLLNGTDELDGDKIGIDFAPVSYTPSTAAPEADDLKHLTAHLKGIDDALGATAPTDHGALTGLADDDHPQYQLRSEKDAANGYVGLDAASSASIVGSLTVGNGLIVTGDILVTGTVDGRDVSADGSKLDTIELNAKDDQVAAEVPFNPTGTGLVATNVQDAIAEVEANHTTDHGALVGLGDDDHPQYQLRSEKDQLNGYPGLDATGKIAGTQITYGTAANTACEGNDPRLSDARQPLAHAGSHINGGTDELDGDKLKIDFAPVEYTPSTAPPEADNLTDLAAHLYGIDTQFAALNNTLTRIKIRNQSGLSIPKGKLVYAVGWSAVHDCVLVGLADKDDPSKSPAIGITEESVNDSTNSFALVQGLLRGIDTSAYSSTDELALGNNGGLSLPPPDLDPFTGSVQKVASVVRVDGVDGVLQVNISQYSEVLNATQLLAVDRDLSRGRLTGGQISAGTGLQINVAAGSGYVTVAGAFKKVSWSASSVVVPASSTVYVYVDGAGTISTATTLPDPDTNVILGRTTTDASAVVASYDSYVDVSRADASAFERLRDAVGPITASGGLAATNGINSLGLDVSDTVFYVGDLQKTSAAASGISFNYWYRDGGSGHKIVTGQTSLSPDQYDDGSGTLAAVPAGAYKKDALYVSVNAGVATYHVVYGQKTFVNQLNAEAGELPDPPDALKRDALRLAGLVLQEGGGSIVSIKDARPFLGQLGPSSELGMDHGSLAGLSDDDHPQYQLRSEKDAAGGYLGLDGTSSAVVAGSMTVGNGLSVTGDITVTGTVDGRDIATDGAKLDTIEANADVTDFANVSAALASASAAVSFNNQNITNVGLVDGVDVSSHASGHIAGGSDIIDADRLDITWVPTNYTRNTAPVEVVGLTELTAHLAGIDTKVGELSDHGNLAGLADDDHPQYQLRSEKDSANGYVGLDALQNASVVGSFSAGNGLAVTGNITVTGTVDGRDVAVDGSKLDTIETNADVTDFANVSAALAAATAAVSFNSQNLTNVGTVNGVSVEGHASRHISGGADVIDGDRLSVDFVPTNYTRTTTAEAPLVTDLTAHLKGLDDSLGAGGSIFGADFQEALSAGVSTTTSSTFQTKVSLVTPAGLNGIYRVGWNAFIDNASRTNFTEARLFDATAAAVLGATAVVEMKDVGNIVPVGSFVYITMAGISKTFEVQWRTNPSSTAGIRDARIEFWRVA